MDYSGINYDYNDNVYLVSNISRRRRPTPRPRAWCRERPPLQLDFDAAVTGTLADADGQGTGFRSTQPNERDVTVGSDSYLASLLDLDTTAGGTLRVTSSGTATEGTNGGNDNTLVNGLRLPFDGTGDPFSVAARIAGPVTQYDAGSEQAGIQLGNDQDNFVKVAVIEKTVGATTGPASSSSPSRTAPAPRSARRCSSPTPAGVTNVDLALLADPGARTVKAAYRTNGGAWTVLPTTFTVPAAFAGKLFDARSYAGLLVSHKGGPQLVARYESFGIVSGNATGDPPAAREALLRLDTGSATPTPTPRATSGPPTPVASSRARRPTRVVRTDAIAGTTEDPLYATYRGNTGGVTPRTLTYTLPTKACDQGRPAAALRRAGRRQQRGGQATLRHRRRGQDRAPGFDIFAAAGGLNTATVLGINNVTVDGRLARARP